MSSRGSLAAELLPPKSAPLKGSTVPVDTFEVVVRGRLSPMVVTALDGFDVSRFADGRTHLVGAVRDQAKIHGLLRILGDLNIELVSMNPVGVVAHR
jgi:hypothetical protein